MPRYRLRGNPDRHRTEPVNEVGVNPRRLFDDLDHREAFKDLLPQYLQL